MQNRGTYMDRGEVARLWFAEEYEPVVELLRAGDLIDDGETETEAYMRVAPTATACCARTSGATR